jgi:hypothetical protein
LIGAEASRWPALFNASGRSDGRFSPLAVVGGVIPTLHATATQAVALWQPAFQEVHASGELVIAESIHLARRAVVALTAPELPR